VNNAEIDAIKKIKSKIRLGISKEYNFDRS
jgi:hypothetical protein